MELTSQAKAAIERGSIKIRVKRSGMYQQLTFFVRKTTTGDLSFVELFTERVLDTSELLRVSNEVGLPLSAPNGKAFPTGKSAKDFSSLVALLPSPAAGSA